MTRLAPARTSAAGEPSDAQKAAYESLVRDHACRICGEAHPFTCPYIKRATMRSGTGEFVNIELRDEFYRDYVSQIPHGPEDIET